MSYSHLASLALCFLVGCSSANFTVSEMDEPSVIDDTGSPSLTNETSAKVDTGGDGGDAGVDSGADAAMVDTADATPCSVTHTNGVGQTWIDCRPLGTYDVEQAQRARSAWPFPGTTSTGVCSVTSDCLYGMSSDDQCVVWCYQGPLAGKVLKSTGSCACPKTDGTSWL